MKAKEDNVNNKHFFLKNIRSRSLIKDLKITNKGHVL